MLSNSILPITPQGWMCPKCGSAHGPHIATCPTGSNFPLTPYPGAGNPIVPGPGVYPPIVGGTGIAMGGGCSIAGPASDLNDPSKWPRNAGGGVQG